MRIRINLSKLTIDIRIGIIERDWHPYSPFQKKDGKCGKAQTITCCSGISVADPGCLFLIPDPIFFIPDPGSKRYRIRIRIKEFKYFKPKKLFLSSRKYDSGCSSRIRIFPHPGSRIRIQGSKKHRLSDPDPQHWEIIRRGETDLDRIGGAYLHDQ